MGIGDKAPRAPPATPPFWPRVNPAFSLSSPWRTRPLPPPKVAVVPMSAKRLHPQPFDVDQPRHYRPAPVALDGEDKLVHEALAAPSTMRQKILQLLQPPQMQAQLRIAPARRRPDFAPREAVLRALDPLPLALRLDHLVDQQQQPPRLRRQLIERTPQHLGGQPVRYGDVAERGFDVLEGFAAMLPRQPWPLMLMQERDGMDQRQVLRIIAPRPGLPSWKVSEQA